MCRCNLTPESWLVWRGWVGKGGEMGIKWHCNVHKHLQSQSRSPWEHFTETFILFYFLANLGALSLSVLQTLHNNVIKSYSMPITMINLQGLICIFFLRVFALLVNKCILFKSRKMLLHVKHLKVRVLVAYFPRF